jgi:hypothetical protein
MSPADVFYEWEMPEEEEPLAGGGEDWDEELLVPAQGRLLYVGQGQCHYTFFHQPTPGLLYPKRKKKRKRGKKKSTSLQFPPAPLPPPAPIDWGDWEEMCQGEDWEEICPPAPREDWDAEISASQDKEDWDAEIATSQLSDVKDAYKNRQSDRKKYLAALCVI